MRAPSSAEPEGPLTPGTIAPESSPPVQAAAAPDRRVQLVELAVFLFLVVPSLAFSLFLAPSAKVGFVVIALATILRDLSLLALILFFLWRNGESLQRIGLSFAHARREALLGVLVFVPFTYGMRLVEELSVAAGMRAAKVPLPSLLHLHGPLDVAVAIVLVVVVAVAEETIFRGYLLLRFRALDRRPVVGVVLSSLIFALGHGYEGSAGLVTVAFSGVGFAVLYLLRGSLVAPMVVHFLQDLVGLVLLP